MKLEELVSQKKKRDAVFLKMGKPFFKVSSFCSGALFLYRFYKNYGEITFPLVGLAALTFVLFYYATSEPAVKLFLRRTLALLIDLFLIGVVLFVSVSWYQTSEQPSGDILQIQLGRILMGALWLAFLYFVFFDWWFKGTVGKRFVGLTVTTEERGRISFCRSFIRTFLSLPLPVISGAYLFSWIAAGTQSTVRVFIADLFKNSVVSLVPLSILMFEGNQSIADRLTQVLTRGTHVVVRAEHEPVNLLPNIEPRRWVKLCCFNFGWALLFAILFLPVVKDLSKPPGNATLTWTVPDQQGIATLWMVLPMGMKEPMFGIRRIELLNVSPNPFTFQAEGSHFTGLLTNLELNKVKVMPVLRVTLTRERPLQVKLLIVRNYMSLVSGKTPIDRRPSYGVLQLATESNFGLFEIDQDENILLCYTASGKDPVDFYTDIRPHGKIQFPVSIDKTAFLLVGAGIAYHE